MSKKTEWKEWFDAQSPRDQYKMAIVAISRLIEIEEISFRADDLEDIYGNNIPEEEVVEECLFWDSCGDNIIEDYEE